MDEYDYERRRRAREEAAWDAVREAAELAALNGGWGGGPGYRHADPPPVEVERNWRLSRRVATALIVVGALMLLTGSAGMGAAALGTAVTWLIGTAIILLLCGAGVRAGRRIADWMIGDGHDVPTLDERHMEPRHQPRIVVTEMPQDDAEWHEVREPWN